MTREKAFMMALEIIDQCKQHGEGYCTVCPFNFHGCIVGTGNDIPADWHAREVVNEVMKASEVKRK